MVRRDDEDLAYRVYVTDTLKAITGAQSRYLDWLERKPPDSRTGEEICQNLAEKFGLEEVSGN